MKLNNYDVKEERLNIWSHVVGIVMALIGVILLFCKAYEGGTALHWFSYGIYGFALLILFSASSAYHAEKNIQRRKYLKVLDHSSIYFFIASSYIPFLLLGLHNKTGIVFCIVLGGITLVGITIKLFFTGRFSVVSTLSYVAMGCLILFIFNPLREALSEEALFWIVVGGVFYLTGAVLYSVKKIPYNHALFHLFVLGGSFSHFLSIYLYL